MRTPLVIAALILGIGCRRDTLQVDTDLDSGVDTDVDTVDTGFDTDMDSDTDVDSDTDTDTDTDTDIDAPIDADNDGFAEDVDCNDADPTVFPGADERCNGVDDDCSGEVDDDAVDAETRYADTDLDSFGDPTAALTACTFPRNYTTDSSDCDDADIDINPAADERCNGVDDDCDGAIDNDAIDVQSGWLDIDRDQYGDPAAPVSGCVLPRDTVFNDDDCGPEDPLVNPDAEEVCNSIDDNCDGVVDTDATDIRSGWFDADRDGYGDPAAPVRGCQLPLDTVFNDGDCAPDDFAVNPGADEVCNGIDDDCDGVVDTDAIDIVSGWADADRDGFGDPNAPVSGCTVPRDTVFNDDDCAPEDTEVNPDASELCDGIDNDCSGLADDNEAIGAGPTCAVVDCWAALDAGLQSGPTWILWNQRRAFEVYCEQEVDGGGWALLFKNHGGEIPGEASNQTLLESDYTGQMVSPHTEELISDVNTILWNQVRGQGGLTFLKMGTLYTADGAVEHETTLRIDFNANTWDDILAVGSNDACHPVDTPFVVTANGNVSMDSTTYINSYQGSRNTFGLANSGHGADDSCGQPPDNLINDPSGDTLPRADNGSTLNGIRHVFSYVHPAPNLRDASRCQFACWNDDNWGGRYDGFTWGVRQPRR